MLKRLPHHLRLRPSSYPVLRPYGVSLLSHGAIGKTPLLFFPNLLFGPFSLMVHPDGFHFQRYQRYYASIHSLMLSPSAWEALTACPPFPPYLNMNLTLSNPCSCSNSTLSLTKMGSFPSLLSYC